MVVKDLDKTQDDAIMAEIDKAYQNKNAGRWEEAEKHYLHSWKLFPEPKYGWGMSQMMLYFLAEFYLEWKKYDLAKKWAQEVFKCEPNPGDGTPYLFLGKIHYEEGQLDEARKHFEKAHEVSGRRVFQDEDPKYFKFLKDKRK
jgi:tetratricopeptide (TPR) repeat protein